MQVRKTRWSLYDLSYQLWIARYRKEILTGEVREELERLIHEIAEKHKIDILSLSVQPDHVRLSVVAPPRLSVAQMVNLFKGISSRKLLEKFTHLRTGEGLWSRTYYAGSAGAVSEEAIRRYIEEC